MRLEDVVVVRNFHDQGNQQQQFQSNDIVDVIRPIMCWLAAQFRFGEFKNSIWQIITKDFIVVLSTKKKSLRKEKKIF